MWQYDKLKTPLILVLSSYNSVKNELDTPFFYYQIVICIICNLLQSFKNFVEWVQRLTAKFSQRNLLLSLVCNTAKSSSKLKDKCGCSLLVCSITFTLTAETQTRTTFSATLNGTSHVIKPRPRVDRETHHISWHVHSYANTVFFKILCIRVSSFNFITKGTAQKEWLGMKTNTRKRLFVKSRAWSP